MANAPVVLSQTTEDGEIEVRISQKYFDSGDYQMAKQKPSSKSRQLATGIGYVTGDAIPTPESVPVRKTSIIQPTKFTSSSAT
uniref:Uncharacterized protein n=1 Tax=Timema genevievae TaxID=629358 RepID=A0A7R9K9P7_TIMGE|nr:unnamed protein product [Timema genevievae]